MPKSGIYQKNKIVVQNRNSINEILYITVTKEKIKHMIIPVVPEKAFDKIQHTFLNKTLSKLGIDGNFCSIIKNIYGNPVFYTQ